MFDSVARVKERDLPRVSRSIGASLPLAMKSKGYHENSTTDQQSSVTKHSHSSHCSHSLLRSAVCCEVIFYNSLSVVVFFVIS